MPPRAVRRRRTAAVEDADARGHAVLAPVPWHVSSGVALAQLRALSRTMRQSVPPIPRDMPALSEWEHAAQYAASTGRLPALRWILSLDPAQAHGEAPLHDACAADQLACAQLLLAAGAPLVQRCLYAACGAGATRCAQWLLEAGVAPTRHDLVAACEGGHVACVALLLAHGVPPEGKGALAAACANGHLQCARALMAEHLVGDDDQQEERWRLEQVAAMKAACRWRHLPCVEELLLAGGEEVLSPAAMAAACKNGDLSCAQLLLGTGNAELLLDIASDGHSYALDAALRADHAHLVRYLLGQSESADDVRCASGLYWPVRNNSVRCLRLLLEKQLDYDRSLALHDACSRGALECAELLLETTSANTVYRKTSMLKAALKAPRDVVPLVKLLLERGAHPNAPPGCPADDAPALIACRLSDAESLKLLLWAGADPPPGELVLHALSRAVHPTETRGVLDCLEVLLAHEAVASGGGPLLDEALMCAAQRGFPRCVERLLAAGADPNCKVDDQSPLMAACCAKYCQLETARALLAGGARVTDTPHLAHVALRKRDHELLALLLREPGAAQLYATRDGGMTPLMHAAILITGGCLRELLDHHHHRLLDPPAAAIDLQCALTEACGGGVDLRENAERLLRAGAVPEEKHLKGAMQWADERLMRTLLRAGAPVRSLLGRPGLINTSPALGWALVRTGGAAALEWRNGEGRTPLFTWCALRRLSRKFHGRAVGIVRQLLAAGADPNASDHEGATPLHVAASEGDKVVVELLVHAGAAVNAADRDGVTPLMCAALRVDLGCLRALINAGAALNATDASGRSALSCVASRSACVSGQPECVALLLAQGEEADPVLPEALESSTVPPLVAACLHGHVRRVKLLLAHGGAHRQVVKEKALEAACEHGAVRCVEALIAHGVQPTAHALALAQGCALCTRALLQAAPPPGRCAAALRRLVDPACTELLLAHGADPNAAVADDGTPLLVDVVAKEADVEFVELLLAWGADAGARDGQGRTALDVACELGGDAHRVAALANAPAHEPVRRLTSSRKGRADCLRALLQAAPWRVHTADAQQALRGARRSVSALLDAGVVPNDGERAWLVRAMEEGAWDAIGPLLDAGVDPERRHGGLTPLQLAASKGNAEAVRLLLERGAHVDATCGALGVDDATALLLACAGGHAHMVRLLLRHGASIHRSAVDVCALHDADQCLEALPVEAVQAGATSEVLRRACGARRWRCVGPLLRAGAVDDEEGGPSALELACAGGLETAPVIRRLLAAPSSVGPEALRRALVRVCEHSGCDDGATARSLFEEEAPPSVEALRAAAAAGNRRCLRYVLLAAAHAPWKGDERALRLASAGNHHECVRLLLEAGATPDDETLVAATSDPTVTRTLLNASPASVRLDRALHAACARGDAAVVWELVVIPLPPSAWHGALVAACASGSAECARMVLDEGGAAAGAAAVAALHASTSAACTRLLLEDHDVPVDASDHEGTTALMAASARGNLEVVRLLLANGAAVDARRAVDGRTALRLAAERGHAPVVRELVHVGGAALPAEGEEGELERECAAALHDARRF